MPENAVPFALPVSRRSVLAGAAAALILPVWGLRAQAAESGPLVVGIGTDIVSFDPDRYASWNDYWAYGNMFEGLFGPDEKGDLAPALAESVDVSADGLTYVFTLRAGTKFHNGDPVTTADLVFSLARSLDPKTRYQRALLIGSNIAGFEALDERRFQVRLKQIDAETLAKLSIYWQVKPKAYIEAVGDEEFGRKPVGTGPFQFVERRPSEYFKLRAFPDYWGRPARASELTIRIVPEEQSRLAQVMAGEADVATPISPVLAARLRSMPNLQVVQVSSFLNVLLKFNGGHPEMAKKPVRQAVAMAIDRDAMRKTIMLGYAAPQDLWCTSAQPACSAEGVQPYAYDPDKARALLKEAGFDFATPFRFVGQAPGRVAASKETCEAIAEYLGRVGIKVDLQILEFGAWNAILNAKWPKDPSVAMIYATAPDPSRDVAYKLQVNTQTGAIPSWVTDPQIDEMLVKINAFTDLRERDRFMNGILRRLHEEALLLPLWSNDTLYVTRKEVRFDVPPYYPFTILRDVARA